MVPPCCRAAALPGFAAKVKVDAKVGSVMQKRGSTNPSRHPLGKKWARWNDNDVILSYMDEAGGVSYAKPDKSRFFVRSCVLIRESELRSVTESINRVLGQVPVMDGEVLPFHASYIFHGKMKNHKLWEQVDEQHRRHVLQLMGAVIEKHDLPFIYACVDKQRMKEKYHRPINPHVMSFIQAGEMVETWMGSWAKDQHWIPCVGKTHYNQLIENMFMDCCNFGAPFGYWASKWTRTASVMAFTSPEQSKAFLLADLCAFLASRKEQKRNDWDLYKTIQGCLWNSRRFPR